MIEAITSIGGLAIAAISTAYAIIKGKKTSKNSKIVGLAKVVQKIPEYIVEAEKVLGPGTGAAKLQYVLNKVHIECLQAGINYVEEDITAEVEKILNTPQKNTNKE